MGYHHLLKLSLAFALVMAVQSYVRVCYFTNWAQYRNGIGKYSLTRDYQTGLCTHMMFSFGKVVKTSEGYTIDSYEWNDKSALYGQMQYLKKSDRSLKTLLAIGGWTHGSNGFKEMVATKETRRQFVYNSLAYVQKYGFDGLDLDWEFPAERGSLAGDRQRFSELCQELADAYHPKGLLVTAAVKAATSAIDRSYEVAKISRSLDFINLMTYDLYGSWKAEVGHHTNTNPGATPHNVHMTVKAWLNAGASAEKLVLGLGAYGRSFKLKNKCNFQIGTHTAGKPNAGKYTGAVGFLAYYEICTMKFDNHVCTKESSVNAPYGNAGDQWVGYDDQESIVYKINNVMKRHNLKGYMFWALDLDDFSGNVCGQGRYPLMNAAKKASMGLSVSFRCNKKNSCGSPPFPTGPTKTTRPVTTAEPATTKTTKKPGDRKCEAQGPWSGSSAIDDWCNISQHCDLACQTPCMSSGHCMVCKCN